MFEMTFKKTHDGQTAGGMLRRAAIRKMKSGDHFVYIDDYQVFISDSGSMVLSNCDETFRIPLSNRAYRKLETMLAEAESRYELWEPCVKCGATPSYLPLYLCAKCK